MPWHTNPPLFHVRPPILPPKRIYIRVDFAHRFAITVLLPPSLPSQPDSRSLARSHLFSAVRSFHGFRQPIEVEAGSLIANFIASSKDNLRNNIWSPGSMHLHLIDDVSPPLLRRGSLISIHTLIALK